MLAQKGVQNPEHQELSPAGLCTHAVQHWPYSTACAGAGADWLTSVKERDSFGEEVFVGDLVSIKDADELIGGHGLVAGVDLHHRCSTE